jgi:hypothetical protein
LIYADYVNVFGYESNATKETIKALIDTTKEVGLEVKAEKTKFTQMSRYENEWKNRKTRKANTSFENVAKFKYFETTVKINI